MICIRLVAVYLLLILFSLKGHLQEIDAAKGRYAENPSVADCAIHYNQFEKTCFSRSLNYKHSIFIEHNGATYTLSKAEK